MQGPDTQEMSQLALSLFSGLQSRALSEERQVYSAQMEEVEQQLEESISLVKKLKNFSKPVNSLPVRVLGCIFSRLQEDVSDDPFSGNFQMPSHLAFNSWIGVTHVCRHWRSVAHGTPSLWTRIDIQSKSRHVETFVDKSSPLPLTVFCGTLLVNGLMGQSEELNASMTRALHLLVANANRIGELYFFSSFPVDAVLQRDQFTRMVVPILSLRKSPEGPLAVSHGVDIFSKLFSALSSQGRKLFLHGLVVSRMLASKAPYTLDNLTHLALFNQPPVSNQTKLHMYMNSFLDLLQVSSHSLESLTLVRAGPRVEAIGSLELLDGVSRRPPVRLSALKSLEIGDWASSGDIAHFLAHLVIPGVAKRCIWGQDLKYLSSILFCVDPDTARSKGRGWDMEIRQVTFTAVKGKEMIGIYNDAVYIQGNFNFLRLYPLFRDQSHIFERVEELCLTPAIAEAALTVDEYRLLFATLPKVRRLSMLDMDISLVVQALGLLENFTLLDLPLPGLKEITIRYSRSKDSLPSGYPTHDFLGNEYKLSLLSIALGLAKLSQRRAAIGRPFDNITFDFQVQDLGDNLHTDYLGISEHLARYVGMVTLLDSSFDNGGERQTTDLVLELLTGFWPSSASLGRF